MHRFPPNVHIYHKRILEESILYNLLESNVLISREKRFIYITPSSLEVGQRVISSFSSLS